MACEVVGILWSKVKLMGCVSQTVAAETCLIRESYSKACRCQLVGVRHVCIRNGLITSGLQYAVVVSVCVLDKVFAECFVTVEVA